MMTIGEDAKSAGEKRSFGEGPNEVAIKLFLWTEMDVIFSND